MHYALISILIGLGILRPQAYELLPRVQQRGTTFPMLLAYLSILYINFHNEASNEFQLKTRCRRSIHIVEKPPPHYRSVRLYW